MILGLLFRFGPWLLLAIAGLVIWGLWGALGTEKLKLAQAEEVNRIHAADAKRSAESVARLADALQKTETKVVTVTERIYAAPITRDCAQSPAMRAATDGVRQLLQPAGGQAPAGREPPAAVQRPGAGAGAGQRQRHRGRAGAGGESLRRLPG